MRIFKARIISLLVAAFGFLPAFSTTIVKDSTTGEALPKASVFDRKGNFIAVADENGVIPKIPEGKYPLSIHFVGYSPGEVSSPSQEEVKLVETDFELPELVVDATHNIMYLTAYVREYTVNTASKDTTFAFAERIVDFMIPKEKVKKFKGWEKPRELFSETIYHYTDNKGLDSVGIKPNNEVLSWYNLIQLFNSKKIPSGLRSDNYHHATVPGKYSDLQHWTRKGNNYLVELDALANEKDHVKSPNFLKMLGMTIDMTKADAKYKFSDVESDIITIDELQNVTFNVEAAGKGKMFKYAFDSKDPVQINSYIEVYILDRAYLSKAEAEEIKKHKPDANDVKFIIPKGVPPLHDEIAKLKDRAEQLKKH